MFVERLDEDDIIDFLSKNGFKVQGKPQLKKAANGENVWENFVVNTSGDINAIILLDFSVKSKFPCNLSNAWGEFLADNFIEYMGEIIKKFSKNGQAN